MEKKKIVIALGGNALGKNPKEQLEAVKITAKSIVGLIEKGHDVVVTHGNGPQVGMISLAFLESQKHDSNIPDLPLSLAGSMSQGYIGLHLQQQIKNLLREKNIEKDVVSVISQVVVDKNDPSFDKPSKPIGIFYTEEEANNLAKQNGWSVMEDAGRGWRRTVASPKPVDIVEKNVIKNLVDNGTVVIAGGGGGIPTFDTDGKYIDTDAVIDKDFTGAKIAELVDADIFMIVTAVDGIYINYNKPDEKRLHNVSIADLEKMLADGIFPAGSMAPKVEAAIQFAKSTPSRVSIITSLESAPTVFESDEATFIKE